MPVVNVAEGRLAGFEADVVIGTGTAWGAFEIRLGAGHVDAAAAKLLRFAARVGTSVRGQPAVLGERWGRQ